MQQKDKNEKQEHKTKPCNRRMKKGNQKRKKPSASLYTSVVKPNQLEEEKPRKLLEKVI